MSNSPLEPSEEIRRVTDAVPLLLSYIDADLRYRFHNKAYADWFGHAPDRITGRHVMEIIGEAAYQTIRPHLEAALAGRRVAYETAMPYERIGTRFVHTEMIPDVAADGQVRGLIAYVQDISARRRVEVKLESIARQQAVLIAAQQEVALAAGGLDAVLEVVTRRAQEMTAADGAVVEMAEGDEMVYRAASGTAAAHLGLRLRRDSSLSGRCVAEGRLLSCEDSETDPRVDRDACRRIGVRSLVVVPLQFLGRTVGVLKVYAATPSAFHTDEMPLLELMVSLIVAALSGVAEAEARHALSAGRQEAAERQRQFLHDVLLSVTDGCLHLCDGPEDLPTPLTPFGDPLPVMRDGSLGDLRSRVREAAQAAGLSAERAYDLVTAVGEASMNAVVHAGAGIGQISMADGKVQMRMEDQGEGITFENLPKATLSRGFSTKESLGHGFKMMLQTVDRIFLLTGVGGTTIVLEQNRQAALPSW